MDISKKYIKMCEKAKEIQDIRKGFSSGDLGEIWRKNEQIQVHRGKVYVGIESIWLPRQDQLQEMVANCTDDNGKYGKGAYLLRVFVEWMPISKGNESGSSLEQLWLAFVMHEKYQKKWDGESWQTI